LYVLRHLDGEKPCVQLAAELAGRSHKQHSRSLVDAFYSATAKRRCSVGNGAFVFQPMVLQQISNRTRNRIVFSGRQRVRLREQNELVLKVVVSLIDQYRRRTRIYRIDNFLGQKLCDGLDSVGLPNR